MIRFAEAREDAVDRRDGPNFDKDLSSQDGDTFRDAWKRKTRFGESLDDGGEGQDTCNWLWSTKETLTTNISCNDNVRIMN